MTLSKIINLLLPPIFVKLWRKIFPQKQPKIVPLPKLGRGSQKMVVIGNGPSLRISLEKYTEEIKKYDRIAVNYFASTKEYLDIKPNFYAFADPMWFGGKQEFKDAVKILLDTIVSVTTWDMVVVMPDYAREREITTILSQNPNLKLRYYYSGYSFDKKLSQFEAWDKNLVAPPAGTVLNVCVWLALYMGYEETYIVGADTSFLADIQVDQQTNELYTIDQHFYENKDVYKQAGMFDSSKRRKHSMTMSQLLEDIGEMFKAYDQLSAYAKWKGLGLYNASEYSWVDSIERKNLKQC